MTTPEAAPGATDGSDSTACTGRGTPGGDHCCYVRGQVCLYLADNGPDAERRFECSLRRDLGSWAAVHSHIGYLVNVQSAWDELGTREDGSPVIASCGDWQPSAGECCREAR